MRSDEANGLRLVFVWAAACGVAWAQRPLFDAPLIALPAAERFATTLDVDGDGVLDAVTLETAATTVNFATVVRVRRSAGYGRFLAPSSTTTIAPSTGSSGAGTYGRARRARLNADGFDDFIVTSGRKISYFVADGFGGAAPALEREVSGPIEMMTVGDFDGDGDDDLAVNWLAGVMFVRTDLAGAPPAVQQVALTPHLAGMAAAELTGDGVCDLAAVVAGPFLDTTTTVLTLLGGAPASASAHGIGSFSATAIVAGDPDGDGDVDLLVSGAPGYFLIRRFGPGTLGLEPTIYPSSSPFQALADLDGDGDPEGLAIFGPSVQIARNEGGTFAAPTSVEFLGTAVQPPAIADLDGDGASDLLVGRSVRLSPPVGAPGPIAFAGPPSSLGAAPLGVADYDGDGDADFDVDYAGTYAPHRNDGSGYFTSAPIAAVPAPPGSFFAGSAVPGDWDGDGDVDLLIERRAVSTSGPAPYLDLRLLRNLGGGDYVDTGPATSAPTRLMFTVASPTYCDRQYAFPADVDGDGDLDLTTSWPEPTWGVAITRVWLNAGAGFLVEGPTQAGVRTVAVVDVNDDGKADLVQVGQDVAEPPVGAPASIRLAMGGGAFFQAVPLPFTPSVKAGRGAADLDGDGDLDWAYFPNPLDAASPLMIAWGDGNGGYPTSSVVLSGAETPSKTVPFAADVDADGTVDLVVGGLTTALVLRGLGGGAFAVDEILTTPNALVDVDGDGDLDVLGGRPSRGARFQGAAGGLRLQYGESWRNAPGQGPVLGASGPFRAGAVGTLRARRAVGGAPALLAIGVAPMNEPSIVGGDLLVAPVLLLPVACDGPAGAPGEGRLDLPFFAPPEFAGATFYSQLFALDAASATGFGVSNGLTITFGGP